MEITTIIILGIILAILVIGSIMYFKIKNNIEDFSSKVFGTPNILEGFKHQEEEYNETPKSLSSMDSVMIPKILTDFPNINIDEIKRMSEQALLYSYDSVRLHKLKELKYATNSFNSKLNNLIEEHKDLKLSGFKIHRTVINNYKDSNGKCSIIFQTAFEYKINNSKVQDRQNVEMIYIYDDTKLEGEYGVSLNCKNCGAPIKSLGVKTCPYCGTGVIEYTAKTWKVNNISKK